MATREEVTVELGSYIDITFRKAYDVGGDFIVRNPRMKEVLGHFRVISVSVEGNKAFYTLEV